MPTDRRQKLLIIVGPTASGKSDLAVALAENYDGEIISADSRQVYRGLDIGTGKITSAEMRGVRHYALDIADAADSRRRFTVADWKRAAESAISDISSRGKLPIVCGGTGFYVQALANNREYPDIDVDPDEQSMLESEPSENLLAELRRLDPRRAASMQTPSEAANRRHLARAILIARELGAVPAIDPADGSRSDRYDILLIGIRIPDDELKERIRRRLEARLDGGMIDEARRLHEDQPRGIGLSYERMNNLGLEYRYLAKFLRGEIPRERLTEILATKIWQYARRQKTWFKRDPRINWFAPTDLSAIRQSIETWLHSSAD